MFQALRHHWPEYLMEAAGLGIFMISAGVFTTLLLYPRSPMNHWIGSPFAQRSLIGLAMGLTAAALIYSPWGQQSGAHYNPAVTLTFLHLRKVQPWDAFFYIAAQFLGGLSGVLITAALLQESFRQPPVFYVATLPGRSGSAIAFLAEALISFLMMGTILIVSNNRNLAQYTGLFAGLLVFIFITFEAPFSGMSMNPARTMSSAAPARTWTSLWVYFVGPLCGMLAAAEAHVLVRGRHSVSCAKLNHQTACRCIFCGSPNLMLRVLIAATALATQTHWWIRDRCQTL